jgi:UDP-N-acetylmuramate--alanine ligase
MFNNKKIHLIGIGGISMSGIAKLLLNHNCKVTGYDATESALTDELTSLGINVVYNHDLSLIDNADIVVYTAAIAENDPERVRAKEKNKTIYERAEFLGLLSKEYENCICISGTHGKSTTTGMVSLAFMKAGLNPTIQIGAILNEIGGNTKIGSKKYLIMEACEYVDSFLHFHPTSEIVLNIDDDHLNYFKNIENTKKSFRKYVNLLPNNGFLVMNADDDNSKTLKDANPNIKVITYGIKNNAIYMAKNINYNDLGHATFDLYKDDKLVISIELGVQGSHNIYNALAAFALASEYINDTKLIKEGIEAYHGVKRRFELIGKYNNNITVYDDYAHHPTEVQATWDTAKNIKCHESWAVFQSHTFSRTAEHYKRFAEILSHFDHVVIAKIYPARETNTFGIKEEMIVDEIKAKGTDAIYIDDFDKIVDYLKENLKSDDIVITIGAGPINEVGLKLLKK